MAEEKMPENRDSTVSRNSETATADYLRDMLTSLTGIARNNGHNLLAYLLGVAAHEAARLAKKT